MNKYGLIGNKISYSLSPKLHNLIARELGKEISYELIDINEKEIVFYIKKLKDKEYAGFNVTIPYKEKVMKYVEVLTGRAKKIGSVNTLYINDEGLLVGDNTDYYGFSKLITINESIKDVNRAYILGTGGAAKTVFNVLNDLNVDVINVSREKMESKDFNSVITYEELKEVKDIDLLINCTPVGSILHKGVPIIKANQKINKVIDLIYNPLKTDLMKLSYNSVNGLEMLIYQGLKSQLIWNNIDLSLNEEETIFNVIKEELINEFIW